MRKACHGDSTGKAVLFVADVAPRIAAEAQHTGDSSGSGRKPIPYRTMVVLDRGDPKAVY